jgi:hypothetical protein
MYSFRIFYTPDAEPTTRTSSTPAIPQADLDLLAVAEAVSAKGHYLHHNAPVENASAFARNVSDYRAALTAASLLAPSAPASR